MRDLHTLLYVYVRVYVIVCLIMTRYFSRWNTFKSVENSIMFWKNALKCLIFAEKPGCLCKTVLVMSCRYIWSFLLRLRLLLFLLHILPLELKYIIKWITKEERNATNLNKHYKVRNASKHTLIMTLDIGMNRWSSWRRDGRNADICKIIGNSDAKKTGRNNVQLRPEAVPCANSCERH